MLKLTGGYEYRTYWFELFETVRKVLLVGIPSTFPGRGGTAQLFWGLLICFASFGACIARFCVEHPPAHLLTCFPLSGVYPLRTAAAHEVN